MNESDTSLPPPPSRAALARLLAEHAPLAPAPLCPEVLVHQAHSLVAVWEAAERLSGHALPSPFWAYAWPGGAALARVLLDRPALVRGRRVLDFGAGGGVAALAALRAGAAEATANDSDAWAVLVAELAAAAQGLPLRTLLLDLCAEPGVVDEYDVVLCADLAYERSASPGQRRVLQRALDCGALVLVGDAGRAYFDSAGMRELAAYRIAVSVDLEGVGSRTARVYELIG
jgi:predicted nicotinamide N-methyase